MMEYWITWWSIGLHAGSVGLYGRVFGYMLCWGVGLHGGSVGLHNEV